MFHFENKTLFGKRKLPLILQNEATECGLACIGMIAGFYGFNCDMASLRSKHPISLKGETLAGLIGIANELKLTSRPLKLDISHLPQLKLPCVVHWNFKHFVVLEHVSSTHATIYDPAIGVRRLTMDEFSNAFTGVALELWPNEGFQRTELKPPPRIRQLMGRVTGLSRSLGQILVLALSLEIVVLVLPFFLQWVIDQVVVTGDRDLLLTLAIGFGLLVFIQHGISMARTWALIYMGTLLNIQWRANAFTHMINLPVNYFERRHLGDIVSRFGTIDQIQKTMTTSFIEAILDGLMTALTLLMMFVYSKLLSAIALGAIVLYALGRWAWYRPLRSATEEQIIHAAKQQSHFLETVRGVKAIKLFQRQNERRSAWLALLADQINAEIKTQKYQMFYRFMNGILFGLENVLVISIGASLMLDGNFSAGVLIAFLSYKNQFDARSGALIDKFFEVRMLRLQGNRLADILHTETEPTGFQPGHQAIEENTSITISNLSYKYAEHEPTILNDVNLKIAPGESIAITGPSGCGKSTLINLLLGVLKPTAGEIKIGEVDIAQSGYASLRSIVGTVMQDDVLFAGSIAENVTFFDPKPDFLWMKQCANVASIAAEISAMPMGFNTLVGDMGTVLSGGQKQRILLARALYKRPKILFLDEATSHLDVLKEKEVSTAIKALNITRLIVAHRPETISSADRVIELVGGKIVQDSKNPAPLSSSSKAMLETAA